MHFLRNSSFLLEKTKLGFIPSFLNGKKYLQPSLLAKLSFSLIVGTSLIMSHKYLMVDEVQKQQNNTHLISNQNKIEHPVQNQGKQNQREYLNRIYQAKLLLQIWRESEAQLNSYQKNLQDLEEKFKKTQKTSIWSEKYQEKHQALGKKLVKCQNIENPFQTVKNSKQFSIQNLYKLNLYFDEMIQCNRARLELHEIYTEFFEDLANTKVIS